MAFIFGYSNLVVANNSGAPTQQVDMTADWIVVDDGSGNTLRVPMTTTVTINKADTTQTSTMVNGRDQAALFPASTTTPVSNVWINIWAIYNPVTNTIAGLFSLSATAPTLPSGYTHKAWVGAVYNDVSGNFTGFYQSDNNVSCTQMLIPGIVNATLATGQQVLQVPPMAKAVKGKLRAQLTAPPLSSVAAATLSNTVGSTYGTLEVVLYAATASAGDGILVPYCVNLITPQTVWCMAGANSSVTLWYFGWTY